MDRTQLAKLCRGFANPSRSVAHIRGKQDNLGDIMVKDAVEEMLAGLTVQTCARTRKVEILDSLIGIRRVFKYCALGGGTLIFAPRGIGWLETTEYLVERTTPLCVLGTGVIDPSFFLEQHKLDLKRPIINADCVEAWVQCLRRFPFVAVRGVESQRILGKHGFADAEVSGDPALFYARDEVGPRSPGRRMGFNISHLPPFWGSSLAPAVRTLTAAVHLLEREGWTITLMPTQPEEEPLAHEIAREIGSSRVFVFRQYLEPKQFLDVVAAQDLFVGVKLHSVIAACCVHTPAIMIGYQPKCTDFMRTMDLERYLIRTDVLKLDDLLAMVAEVSADPEPIRRKQFAQCQHYRARLLDLRDRVLASIGAAPPRRERRPGSFTLDEHVVTWVRERASHPIGPIVLIADFSDWQRWRPSCGERTLPDRAPLTRLRHAPSQPSAQVVVAPEAAKVAGNSRGPRD